MKRISVLSRLDADKVNELRVSEYAKVDGFSINPSALLWSRADDQAVVLGAWDGDQLVACARVEFLYDRGLIETKLETPWVFPVPLACPVMIRARAVTRSTHRKSGLHTLLRHWSLVFARRWGAHLVLGTTLTTTPGLSSQLEMGYQFFDHPEAWNEKKFYKPTAKAIVCVLNLDVNAAVAIEVSRRLAGAAYTEYTWSGGMPQPGIVTLVA